MAIIEIENMEFFSYHGCFSEEQAIGTRFRVDLKIEVDTSIAQKTDNIGDTVNYLSVYQSVKKQMEIPSHLLENVADRIATDLIERYNRIENVWVKLTKLNPPLGGKMYGVSLIIEKNRR